jgi:hypothetical protein
VSASADEQAPLADVARVERRAAVRHLAQQEPGLSHRAIAARLGIGKDTVRRDLAQGGAPAAAPPAAPDAPPTPPDAPSGELAAPPDAPDDAVAHDGGRLVIELYPGLVEDLATLRLTGSTDEAVVDYAVAQLAGAYRNAIRLGVLKAGDPIDITTISLRPPPRRTARTS